MKTTVPASLCVAGMLAIGAAVTANAADQSSAQPASSGTADQVTVTGCIQREADFRKAHDAGRGGVAGTGAGAGNEFVLTSVSKSPSGADAGSPTGTSGSASMAYELTGPNEGQAASYVGKRVEITGNVKAAETSAGGAPTGGATAGEPPKGVDVMSKDLKLRELEVTSVREGTGTCPAM